MSSYSMELIQVKINHNEIAFSGQAYILALKDGENSIIINGASNCEYDPNMTTLDETWVHAIRTSKKILIRYVYLALTTF